MNFKKSSQVPSRYVLEKNPFMLNKKRPLNERNFYEYLNAIPSLKKPSVQNQGEETAKVSELNTKRNKGKQFKDLGTLEKENLQLNEDLRDLNEKLSQLIGKKGYQNLLDQLKENKKVFVERPVSRQIKILSGELQNGEKHIGILNKEKARVEKMLEKVISPISFSEIMRKINEKKKEIKELKSQNFELVMENKKVGKILENGGLDGQGILKKLLMQFNTVKAKNDETVAEIERLEQVQKELQGKKEGLDSKNSEVQRKMEEMGLGQWNPEIEKKFGEAVKEKEKAEGKQRILRKNFLTKQGELDRVLKKKQKQLDLLNSELSSKKTQLEELKKEEEEVARRKQKVEEELKEERKKTEEEEKKTGTSNMVKNLKKFKTKTDKKKAVVIGNDNLYSTKTDEGQTEREGKTSEKTRDLAEDEKETADPEMETKHSLSEEKVESEDEVSKLLKNSQPKEEEINLQEETGQETKGNEAPEQSSKKKTSEGNKTPTLNGSSDELGGGGFLKKNSMKVLEEKNQNIPTTLNQYQSFSKVQGDEGLKEADDFDELIARDQDVKKEEAPSKRVADDDDFDFMD